MPMPETYPAPFSMSSPVPLPAWYIDDHDHEMMMMTNMKKANDPESCGTRPNPIQRKKPLPQHPLSYPSYRRPIVPAYGRDSLPPSCFTPANRPQPPSCNLHNAMLLFLPQPHCIPKCVPRSGVCVSPSVEFFSEGSIPAQNALRLPL